MNRTHRNLVIWQLSRKLVHVIYELTANFPTAEKYGLTQQMRRCAVSVPSNIAQGAARSTPKDFCRFLCIARGSLAELETQLILAQDLGFTAATPDIDDIIKRLFNLFAGLMKQQYSQVKETKSSYKVTNPRQTEQSRVTRLASRFTDHPIY